MNWLWPQYVVAGLYALSLVIHAGNDGKPRTGKYSFGMALLSAAFGAWVLHRGGFW